ncbi:DUF305 domain-containing protein [Cellulomonas sp. ATA003]|uniref:DUF305 domain-containing protein n=1 Tax=Cellulomonas sp. ATA003 TaxID=3073064 RepID=UPI0028734541|nr:DUF305 domain-containing protein [Cellulomonas sp. ATA003]WNB85754.1 DUF305 domain-containing protein [Cellulomonas sp. ATA003]
MTTATRHRPSAATSGLIAAALCLSLSACSATPGTITAPTAAEQTTDAGEVGESDVHNDADTQFARLMIVHHEGALEMSELAVRQAATEEVRALAERIADAQDPEIVLMTGWLEAWGEDRAADAEHGAMDHGGTQVEGLSQDEAMEVLSGLEGRDFDRSFLDLMTAHHGGAIEMAEAQRTDGQNIEARDLAARIVADQTREVSEMEALLEGL